MPQNESNLPDRGAAQAAGRILIHKGGALNAHVYRVTDSDGRVRIEKDFSECSWIVRNTLGRFLIFRECWILRCLQGTGVVPGGVEKISPFAMREEWCAGFTLRESCCGVHEENKPGVKVVEGVPREVLDAPIPREFFEALEAGIRAVHRKGFVHLDLHNERNVMVTPGYKPVILDWQSALPLAKVPLLGWMLRRIDMAGVYKFRDRFRPGELDEGRMALLKRERFLRQHFWVPRLKI